MLVIDTIKLKKTGYEENENLVTKANFKNLFCVSYTVKEKKKGSEQRA